MNIKSLLLGSAAALVAVSGARAADAVVVAEPEPMEYVRVCDTYGAGFYYIPGTETCLKIGGMIRYQIDYSEIDDGRRGSVWYNADGDADFENGGFRKLLRAELKIDARSETEYGTFGRYIRLRSNTESGFNANDGDSISPEFGGFIDGGDDTGFFLQDAIISLGGLAMGVSDTLYDGDLLGEYDTGGGDRVHFINYTFDVGNGIALTAALEEADYNYDYMPNVVGKAVITQGWGAISMFAAYDATNEEWSAKAIAAIKATDAFTVNLMGIYNSDPSYYSQGVDHEWSAAAELVFKANDKLDFVLGAQYFGDYFFDDGGDDWRVGAVVNYTIVKDFKAKLAVNYSDGDNVADDNNWGGFLRLEAGF